jgi:hypothetical protein
MASRPGKYAHVIGKLPKFDGVEPERRDVLDAVKAEILAPQSDNDSPIATTSLIAANIDDADNCMTNVIDIAKRATQGKRHASAFAAAYAEVRVVMDKVNDWKSSVQLLLDAYEQLMIQQMEAEGVASLRLEGGASVSTFGEPYGQVVDKEKFRQWCITNGYEGQLQLWPSTMNAITKERLLEGEAPPDGVDVFAKTMVRLNKA